jgi:hypothetical protein
MRVALAAGARLATFAGRGIVRQMLPTSTTGYGLTLALGQGQGHAGVGVGTATSSLSWLNSNVNVMMPLSIIKRSLLVTPRNQVNPIPVWSPNDFVAKVEIKKEKQKQSKWFMAFKIAVPLAAYIYWYFDCRQDEAAALQDVVGGVAVSEAEVRELYKCSEVTTPDLDEIHHRILSAG